MPRLIKYLFFFLLFVISCGTLNIAVERNVFRLQKSFEVLGFYFLQILLGFIQILCDYRFSDCLVVLLVLAIQRAAPEIVRLLEVSESITAINKPMGRQRMPSYLASIQQGRNQTIFYFFSAENTVRSDYVKLLKRLNKTLSRIFQKARVAITELSHFTKFKY